MKFDVPMVILLVSKIFASAYNNEITLWSASSIGRITCQEINNVTFTDEHPFDILGVPMCGTPTDVQLYTNQGQKGCQLDTINLPNTKTTKCLNMIEEQNPSFEKLVVLIHGFLSNGNSQWVLDMKDAIQSVEPTTVVMVSTYNENDTYRSSQNVV